MSLQKRRTFYYIILVILITVIFTLVYNFGMAAWEGRPQPLYRSLEFIIQTFTTTGYGEDAPWQTPQMNFLVIFIQFSGIGLFLAAIDIFAVPWLRNTLSKNAPSSLPERENHVIICGYTPRTETFISELKALNYKYILIEPDEEKANELYEKNYDVIYGDPESTETLKKSHIDKARSVVTDISDEENASITLSVREVNPEIQIVTLIEDKDTKQYLQVAGADKVFSPRQFLGESLATELSTAVTGKTEESVGIGEDFELIELKIKEDSEFCNKTFEEAKLRQRFGVNIV